MRGVRHKVSTRLEAWLLGTRSELPITVSAQLKNGLFSSVPIFMGGVINTIAVAAVSAWLYPSALFIGWLALEIALGIGRVSVVVWGRRAIATDREPPYFLAALLSCAWAASVGFGTVAALLTEHWILAIIACLSAAGMVCGVCLRNYGTPRLAATMGLLILAPCAVAAAFTSEPLLAMISIQLPVYMLTIFSASFSLNRMMISRMSALMELEQSETLNETILQSSPDYTLILDRTYDVVFSNRPPTAMIRPDEIIGMSWLSLLPPDDQPAGLRALQCAETGGSGNLLTHYVGPNGDIHWLDIIAQSIADETGRIIIVSRDITHQKKSEEHALWMARHDALTGLPNRALLQERLDAVLFGDAGIPNPAALLLLDVDNFKTINDTIGHDAGDALLCTFAARLKASLKENDLVARTGGDEFAIISDAATDEELHALGERIFAQLREPFCHDGRLMECGASIGASLIPRHGKSRSEIMKAADIALYAAKTSGRAQLKIFEASMMVEVERHQSMIASARTALRRNAIVPHYQPKVSLRTSRIIGFEALLRWRDAEGNLQGPDVLRAGFDDPALGGPLSERMLDAVLDDVQKWLAAGLDFGHVAINVTASDFRRGAFAERLLKRLESKHVPPSCIQIEVTETVFLGRGAGYVEEALKELSDHGIRIALDDFGTGYASLSHLNQFPVDLLKIDRSFIKEIGIRPDAEAISSTVINLGHCLGLEVIAEGIETPAQEAHLISVGCDTGQGFLYSQALPASEIPRTLLHQNFEQRRIRSA